MKSLIQAKNLQKLQEEARDLTVQLRELVQGVRLNAASSTLKRQRARNLMNRINQIIARWEEINTEGGAELVQYIKDSNGDQGLNIAAEYTATKNAAQAIADYIAANIPDETVYTNAQTTGLQNLCQTFEDTLV